MRTVQSVFGQQKSVTCIGCELAHGTMKDYPGTVYVGKRVHVHQDVEIALPGFLIVSTIRHVASLDTLDPGELSDLTSAIRTARGAQRRVGIDRVQLFQGEDSADHLHVWLFPLYEWMSPHVRGPARMSRAVDDLKAGRVSYSPDEIQELVIALKVAYLSEAKYANT